MRKRLRRLLKLRNSSGFTLVEVVVACALLGILILGIMGFVTPVLASVRDKQKNARAFMLSEAINNYILSTTQNAYYIVTFTGASSADTAGVNPPVTTLTYTGSEFPKMSSGNKGLSSLQSTLGKLGADKYEIRCIGIRWREDQITGEKKLMVTNEKVDQAKGTLDPSKTRLVFDECFYDDLYPIINLENYDNQYQKKNGDVFVDQVPESDVNIAPGLGLKVNVYTNPDCYSVDATTRTKAMVNTVGESYIGFINIKSNVTNSAGLCEIVPNIEVNSYDAARAKDVSKQYTAEGKTYYFPESFIYYIAHKSILN